MTYIYDLHAPDSNPPRYVGKTCATLRHRLGQHLSDKQQNHRGNWIRQLVREGNPPVIREIAFVPNDRASRCERIWIAFYRWLGYPLVNATDGGEGAPGMIVSTETRKKMSDMRRGRDNGHWVGRKHSLETREKLREKRKAQMFSEETRKKLSEVRRGWILSKESREKLSRSKLGHPVSEETRRKISAANKGRKHSEESRRKISVALRGRPKPPRSLEHRKHISDVQRKTWRKRKELLQ